ncbi:MAG: S8 family serine peptidase, partial [Planctomycetes bacterium]|nr:S8 family serine peptidase [Planctomycetota bacterium]
MNATINKPQLSILPTLLILCGLSITGCDPTVSGESSKSVKDDSGQPVSGDYAQWCGSPGKNNVRVARDLPIDWEVGEFDDDGDGVTDCDDLDCAEALHCYENDCTNGIDDDGNGYVDDLIGWDFVASGNAVWPGEDGSLEDNDPMDFNGHGTHTSGTIAATTNNTTGVAGVAGGFGPGAEDGCKIMCLRMGYSFDDGDGENGRTHMSYVAKAFRYAADNGAVAINYSFGSSTGGGIEAATDYAVAAGLVISASAGNSNNSSFGYLQSREDVLCVASTT